MASNPYTTDEWANLLGKPMRVSSECAAFRYDKTTVALLMHQRSLHRQLWLQHINIAMHQQEIGEHLISYVPYMPKTFEVNSRTRTAAYISEMWMLSSHEETWDLTPIEICKYCNISVYLYNLIYDYVHLLWDNNVDDTKIRIDARPENIRKHKGRWILYDPFFDPRGGKMDRDEVVKSLFCRA